MEKQQKGIANVSEELQELDNVNNQLKGILSKKFAKVSEVAGQLGGSFKELGGTLKEYDEGLGDTIETMGDLLNVAGAVASFASGAYGYIGHIYFRFLVAKLAYKGRFLPLLGHFVSFLFWGLFFV